MSKFLSKMWGLWKKIGLILGNFVSAVFLTIFYFTVFAILAIPYRVFARRSRSGKSSFIIKKSTPTSLGDYKYE
jgi:hypothetical protein